MSDPKKCVGCIYWRMIWATSEYVCNHLLDTGKRRVEVDGVCLSGRFEKAVK